jgi:plasmid replication initiation protein
LFLELNWEIFNSFTGKYEAILYKLCKDYEKSGGKRTPEFSIEGFKEYMGIKDGEYQEFKRLAMRVINEPIKKINESQLSDIKITAQYNTKGRKVVGLYFEIESRNQQSLPIGNDNADDPFMIARVPIPMTLQTEYLKTHTLEDAKLCIQAANEWIDGKIKAGETVVHGRAYRKALEENWKPNKKDVEAQVKVIEAKQAHATKNEAAKEKAEAQEAEDKKKRFDLLASDFDSLPESDKAAIRSAFESQLNQTLAISWNKAKAKNPANPQEWISVRADFLRFYEKTKST